MTKDYLRRSMSAAVAGLALLVVAAGCGGNDNNSSSSGSSSASSGSTTTTSSSNKATGEPIRVMVSNALTGTSIVFPQNIEAVKATAAWINDNGGINGRPLKVDVCDNQGNANRSAACARQAVANKDVAMVGSFSLFSDQINKVLNQAKIANWGLYPINATDLTLPISFPFEGGPPSIVAEGVLAGQKCNKVATSNPDIPASKFIQGLINAGLASQGKKPVAEVNIPTNVTDFSATAAKLVSSGADCVILGTTGALTNAFVPALKAAGSKQTLIGSAGNSVGNETLKTLGDQLEGAYATGYLPPFEDPSLAEYRTIMNKYADTKKYDMTFEAAMSNYVSTRAFADLLRGIKGDINHDTVLAAASKAKVNGLGIVPNLDFSKEFDVKGMNRLFNRDVYYTTVKDGKIVLAQPKPEDMSKPLGGSPMTVTTGADAGTSTTGTTTTG